MSTGTTDGADDVRAAYDKAPGDEPFARLLPQGHRPSAAAVTERTAARVHVAPRPGRRPGRLHG
ncbi:hypothetical protein JQK87_32320, partial [Streptomyces sp. G44]|nr:hypothetical protein [Streptomyces sp. G44]